MYFKKLPKNYSVKKYFFKLIKFTNVLQIVVTFLIYLGLLKQWQEILEMIIKRLELSEAYNKIMEEVKTFESNLDHLTSGLNKPQQLFHCKEDLEKHIQILKVSVSSKRNITELLTQPFTRKVDARSRLMSLIYCRGSL